MKKLGLLLFVLLFGLSLVGCNTTTQTTTYQITVTQRLEAPTNLVVQEKQLTWSAVFGATSYDVYINDVFHSNRTTTNFDFSNVSGNQLVFRVVAKGNNITASLPSASAAYVSNAAAEAALIRDLMEDKIPNFSLASANEMVRKGMTGQQFIQFKADFNQMNDAMDTAKSPTEIQNAMKPLLDGNYPMEAIINGILHHLISTNANDPMMQALAQAGQDEIALLLSRLLLYVKNVSTDLNQIVLGHLDDITNSEKQSLTAQELFIAKDELITIFKENLPPVGDFELFYQLLTSMLAGMNASPNLVSTLESTSSHFATAQHSAISLMLDYYDSLTVSFFESLLTIIKSQTFTEQQQTVEVQILMMKNSKVFLDANQARVDAIKALVPAEKQELLYTYFQDSVAGILEFMRVDQMSISSIVGMLDNLDYASLQAIQSVEQKLTNIVTDYLISTDGELLRIQAKLSGFTIEYTGFGNEFKNTYTGQVYIHSTAYSRDLESTNIDMMNQIIIMVNEILAKTTQDDFDTMMLFVNDNILSSVILLIFGNQQQTEFQNQLKIFLESESSVLRELLIDLFGYLQNASVVSQLRTLYGDLHTYRISLYGPDYIDNPSRPISNDYYYHQEVATKIFVAGHLKQFMTSAMHTKIEASMGRVFTFLKQPTVLESIGLTLADINELETNSLSVFRNVLTEAELIRTYNYKSLTQAQKERVLNWLN